MSNNIVEDFFEQFEKVSGRAVFWYNIRITTDQYFNINFFIVSRLFAETNVYTPKFGILTLR
jgi:hypothetical protein